MSVSGIWESDLEDNPKELARVKASFDKFVEALEALSAKHGIAIGGCGCCGSPQLVYEDKYCRDDVNIGSTKD